MVDVFPASGLDRMQFQGFTAEVWMKPGVKKEDINARAAAHYKTKPEDRHGRIALVRSNPRLIGCGG